MKHNEQTLENHDEPWFCFTNHGAQTKKAWGPKGWDHIHWWIPINGSIDGVHQWIHWRISTAIHWWISINEYQWISSSLKSSSLKSSFMKNHEKTMKNNKKTIKNNDWFFIWVSYPRIPMDVHQWISKDIQFFEIQFFEIQLHEKPWTQWTNLYKTMKNNKQPTNIYVF